MTRRGRATIAIIASIAVAGVAVVAVRFLGPPTRAVATSPEAAPTAGQTAAAPTVVWGPAEPVPLENLGSDVVTVERVDDLVRVAPVVVVAGPTTEDVLLAEVAAGVLAAPVVAGLVREDLLRWQTRIVVVAGDVALGGLPADIDVRRVERTGARARLPETLASSAVLHPRSDATTALADIHDLIQQVEVPRVTATALFAGGAVESHQETLLRSLGVIAVEAPGADPRAAVAAIAALPEAATGRVVLVGAGWTPDAVAAASWRFATARHGLELPGGGQLLFPGRRLVALYGHPEGGALGVLGEQGPVEAVARATEIAAPYREFSGVPIVPTFELIATVASASAEGGDYSRRTPVEQLRPWVEAAAAAGFYVVLDLQPGRTHFLDQAKEYEELLRLPHVGLALDPEWRLGPRQRHLRQIGSVSAAEVNEVAAWLADLTRRERLPQKLLVVHQFKLSMITQRATLITPSELAVVIHMDGQGGAGSKVGTYRALIDNDPPPGVWWGWKHFYDEDRPLRSPAGTFDLDPVPWFISYQ